MQFQILSTVEDVARLAPQAERLARSSHPQPNATHTPAYYLPRLGASRRPRVVACYEEGELTGVLYADELCILGTPTGWAFGGDHCGRGLVLAAPEREAEVVAAASEHLLAHGIHAIRFYWRASGREVIPVLPLRQKGIKVWCKSLYREEGDWLPLAESFEEFLKRLGSHTRRNIRYYRRKLEELGYRYEPALSEEEYLSAVERLNAITDYPTEPERELRDQRFFEQFGKPIRSGLRAPGGELVSVVGGVVSGAHLHVLTQLNDLALRKLSVSLVLRGYIIEDLIQRGFASIHFVNGASPMLGRFCDPVLMRTVSIDRRRTVFHPVKQLATRYARELKNRGKFVPVKLQYLVGSYMVT
jgi:hypothetical protein